MCGLSVARKTRRFASEAPRGRAYALGNNVYQSLSSWREAATSARSPAHLKTCANELSAPRRGDTADRGGCGDVTN
ncbi:hypothetical protein EVAR_79291_1 [Eumeta japonica]|uniref:Uncharacterized protein n=1 Tax=Eumeta variegata TaxID=151549 RepID=A0A4C1TFR6_EUMVA|nr:hypothetical protein EVAR_79291_1 [Eumeta japonica]